MLRVAFSELREDGKEFGEMSQGGDGEPSAFKYMHQGDGEMIYL